MYNMYDNWKGNKSTQKKDKKKRVIEAYGNNQRGTKFGSVFFLRFRLHINYFQRLKMR